MSRTVLTVVAGTALLLAGCGTADEAETTTSSTVSAPPVSESSAGGSTPGSATASESSAGVPESAAAPSSEATASVPVTDTEPGGSVPGGGTGGSITAEQTPEVATVVPTVTAPPGTFPDREEVEAQGVATNPLCEVLSTDEVAVLLGVAVRPATDAAAGTGCLWSSESSTDSFLQLQLVGDPTRYAPPAGAESLSGIGDVAAVAVADGVWTAQAQNPDGTFAVQLAGPTASRDGAVEGLRRLLERY